MMTSLSRFTRLKHGVLAGLLVMGCTVAGAADRVLRIEAPSVVRPLTELSLTVTASTSGEANERVAFLQVEASVDEGKTWTALCYLTDGGATEKQRVGLPVGPAGSQVRVRARAAFRSEAGDVDFRGAPINWDKSWNTWAEPPARHATVAVRNR